MIFVFDGRSITADEVADEKWEVKQNYSLYKLENGWTIRREMSS